MHRGYNGQQVFDKVAFDQQAQALPSAVYFHAMPLDIAPLDKTEINGHFTRQPGFQPNDDLKARDGSDFDVQTRADKMFKYESDHSIYVFCDDVHIYAIDEKVYNADNKDAPALSEVFENCNYKKTHDEIYKGGFYQACVKGMIKNTIATAFSKQSDAAVTTSAMKLANNG